MARRRLPFGGDVFIAHTFGVGARRASHGRRRLEGGVPHYDQDFDVLAGVLSFESRWIAPRGSL